MISLWTNRNNRCFRLFSFEFNCYWLVSSTYVSRYTIHRRSRTHALVHFSSKQTIKFWLTLDVMLWTSRESSFVAVSSRSRAQSFVSCESLFPWNRGSHSACGLWTFSWLQSSVTVGRKDSRITTYCSSVVPSVEIRSIRPTSILAKDTTSFVLNRGKLVCDSSTWSLGSLPKSTGFLFYLLWLKRWK